MNCPSDKNNKVIPDKAEKSAPDQQNLAQKRELYALKGAYKIDPDFRYNGQNYKRND